MRRRALIGTFVVVAAVVSACGRRMDVPTVRAALAPDSRPVFDLVVAVQNADDARRSDSWSLAEQFCRALQWPRCDRAALRELKWRTRLDGADRRYPEAAAARAVADAAWAFGSEDAVRKMVRTELDRIPESDGPGRARVFVRFGIIDTNPDGQAALFAQACVADPGLCDRGRLREAAQREVQWRFVPPGNVVPLYFGGHPSVGGLAGPR